MRVTYRVLDQESCCGLECSHSWRITLKGEHICSVHRAKQPQAGSSQLPEAWAEVWLCLLVIRGSQQQHPHSPQKHTQPLASLLPRRKYQTCQCRSLVARRLMKPRNGGSISPLSSILAFSSWCISSSFNSGFYCWVPEIPPFAHRPMPSLALAFFCQGLASCLRTKVGCLRTASYYLEKMEPQLHTWHNGHLVSWDGCCPARKSLPTLDNSPCRTASPSPLKIEYLPLQTPHFLFLYHFSP